MAEDFYKKVEENWEKIHHELFPFAIPASCEWTEIEDIISVLSVVSKYDQVNHMMYPDGGGMDLDGITKSNERNCVILKTGLNDILKPKKLTFVNFGVNYKEHSYFLLEADELVPSGVYKNLPSDAIEEPLLEITPGQYVDISYEESGEYQGKAIPSGARSVIRHFQGKFLIVRKTSRYNSISATYDGRQNKMTDEELKAHMRRIVGL